jgi:hypothetical protein
MKDTSSVERPAPDRTDADLMWWTSRDWSGGVELASLAGLERFSVRTRNSVYEITVLSPHTGEILVRGGRFFPVHTRARLAGCSLGGSFLKVRAIYPGFLMEVVHEGQTIVTTRIRSIGPQDGAGAAVN